MPTGTDEALQVLQGLDDVERELGELSRLYAKHKKATAKIDAKIAQLNAQKTEDTVEIEHDIRQAELNILQYVDGNMNQFREEGVGGKKSRKFATGKIETKEVPTYDYPDDDELIDLLESNEYSDFVKVKKTPLKSLIKAAIAKDESVAELLKIGIEKDIDIKIKPN